MFLALTVLPRVNPSLHHEDFPKVKIIPVLQSLARRRAAGGPRPFRRRPPAGGSL